LFFFVFLGIVNSSLTGNTAASQALSACGQASLDYSYNSYSQSTSGYPLSYYSPSQNYGTSGSSSAYQLAALIPSSSTTGACSLNQQYKTSASAASVLAQTCLNYGTAFGGTNGSQVSQPPYCCGFNNTSATVNSTSQSLTNCQQGSYDYPYNSYGQSSAGYNVSYYPPSQNYATNSSLYQFTSHIANPSSVESNSHYHHSFENGPSLTPSKPNIELITGNNHCNLRKSTNKSGRGRGKRAPPRSPDIESTTERVFVWSLDETIIIFNDLLKGKFEGIDQPTLIPLGSCIKEMICKLAETHLFASGLEGNDQVNINDVASDDNGQDLR